MTLNSLVNRSSATCQHDVLHGWTPLAFEVHEVPCVFHREEGLVSEVRERIMQVVIRSPGCLMDEVVLDCPGLTWNQVFCELDRMSRNGQVRLARNGAGRYTVTTSQIPPNQSIG
jgi:hypothetical protein